MSNSINKDEPSGIGAMLVAALKGALCGTVLTLALSLILSAILLTLADPDAMVGVLAKASLAVGALLTGLIAVKADSGKSLLTSLVAGAMLVLIMWLASLLVPSDNASPLWTAVMYALCVGVSLLGGFMGRKRPVRIKEGKNSPTALMRKRIGAGK